MGALGEVWILGRHRRRAAITRRAGGGRGARRRQTTPDGLDPPYGVEPQPKVARWSGQQNRQRWAGAGRRPRRLAGVGALSRRQPAYVWLFAGLFAGVVADNLVACDFNCARRSFGRRTALPCPAATITPFPEPCWYAVRENHRALARRPLWSTLWQIKARDDNGVGHRDKTGRVHRRPIENNSSPGQAVYEPFSGNGITIIACGPTGRHAMRSVKPGLCRCGDYALARFSANRRFLR